MEFRNLPPTRGRGKWGREIKNRSSYRGRIRPHWGKFRIVIEDRSGNGVHIRMMSDVPVERTRVPGVRRQDLFHSPCLRAWFNKHDAMIDARIEMAERAEYERLRRESAAQLALKLTQKKARAV